MPAGVVEKVEYWVVGRQEVGAVVLRAADGTTGKYGFRVPAGRIRERLGCEPSDLPGRTVDLGLLE